MSIQNRSYTNEFKHEAAKPAMDSPSVTSAAKSLGIPEATLHTWVQKAKSSGEQVVTTEDGAVSRSGYYSWLTRKPSKRNLANQDLDPKISSVFNEHKSRYGAPRISRVLQANNESCSKNKVARRMKNNLCVMLC